MSNNTEKHDMPALYNAINQKIKTLSYKYNKLDRRSNPRAPHKLVWLLKEMGFSMTNKTALTPKSHASLKNLQNESNCRIDEMARTFCALEALNDWMNKVEDGAKKHQEEMEKQANGMIVQLKTFAALGDITRKNDIPF